MDYKRSKLVTTERKFRVTVNHHRMRRTWRVSIDLLDVGAARAAAGGSSRHAARHTARHATRHAPHAAAALRVHGGHDGRANALNLLALVLELLLLGHLVALEPRKSPVNGFLGLGLVLVLLRVLLSVGGHLLHVLGREARLVVRDRDLVLLAGRLLQSRHVEHAVGIDVEGHVDLRDAARHGRDAREVELAELIVVLGARALALEHLDRDGRLVVRVGREGLALLGGHRRVARNERRHHLASRLEAERERRHVKQEQVLGLRGASAREDGGLHGGAVRHGLVGVDRLGRLLAVEEVREQRLHLRDARRAANQHDVVHLVLRHLRVAQHLLDRVHRATEQVHAELLEARTSDGREEIDALEQRVNLYRRLRRRRERALGALAGGAQSAHRTGVARDVFLVLALELRNEVVHHAVVKVLTTQMRVAGSRLDLKDALLDGEERHIESAAAKVKNQYVALCTGLLVEAVRDRRRGWLVDDAQAVEASNGGSILGRGALRVVEVGGDGDDGARDILAEVRLGDFLHLDEHHSGDLFGEELLILALVLDLDRWAVTVPAY